MRRKRKLTLTKKREIYGLFHDYVSRPYKAKPTVIFGKSGTNQGVFNNKLNESII